MAFITISEIVDIIIMTLAIGYIFSRIFRRRPTEGYDPLQYYKKPSLWEDIKYGAIIAAPAVVLHELAHKFVAMAFGATATLHAPSLFGIPYGWYILIIILINLNFPILFFVGGYVSHTALPALPSAFVAIAGPLTNLIIWLLCISAVKYKFVKRKYYHTIGLMGKLNMFLFIFNMLPLPGFDGWNFLNSLIHVFI
jgi:Zn-dependent protease